MIKQYAVTLVDDTNLNLDCEVSFDNQKCIRRGSNQSIVYLYLSENSEVEVQVKKEDKWSNRHILNKAFMFLFSLDLVWGNLTESENLPIDVNFKEHLKFSNDGFPANITLSKISHVSQESISIWSKCMLAQKIEIMVLVLLIAVVLSFLFAGLTKIIPMMLAFFFDVFLNYAIKSRYSKIYSKLLVLSQNVY